MRGRFAAIVILASLMAPVAAPAASPPNGVLLAGTLTPSFVNPLADGVWCMVDGASTNFLSNSSPVATLITFDKVIYAPTGSIGPEAYVLGGQASLVFGSASTTAGQITFSNDPSIPSSVSHVHFNSFSTIYNPTNHRLNVSFNILFPNCTLPISAQYRN
jgi:hypothetical protein